MIIKPTPGDEKVAAQLLVETCGFIQSRFGRAFGYEASTDAILRLIAKVKAQTEAEIKKSIAETNP
jgi:hypothetical protein